MRVDEIVNNVGYCGLLCNLCHLAEDCSGCKSNNNRCARHLSGSGCYQYNCCKERKFNGCWECDDFSCGKDMFFDQHDLRLRAFIRFIKEEGLERLAERIIENEKKGIKHGFQKDYDGLETEADVIRLLKTGIRIKNRK